MTRRSPWEASVACRQAGSRRRYRVGTVDHLAPQTFSTRRGKRTRFSPRPGRPSSAEHGSDVNAASVPLADYATRWLRERALLRPRTSELYEGLLRLQSCRTLGPSSWPISSPR